MMEKIIDVLSNINKSTIIIFFLIIFFVFYLLISLVTRSKKEPLKYLGVTLTLIGLVILIIILFSNNIVKLVLFDYSAIIIDLLPYILKPLLFIGLLISGVGLLMFLLYKIIKK